MKYYIIIEDEDGSRNIIDTTHSIERAKKEYKSFARQFMNKDVIIENEHGQEVEHHYH